MNVTAILLWYFLRETYVIHDCRMTEDCVPPWLRKRPAAVMAVDRYLRDGMVVGLGTGNSANMAIDRIVEYCRDGFEFTFVSSSILTEEYARAKGLRITDIDSVDHVDVTFDGADEVSPDLIVIKGLGGALLKEKIIASMTRTEVLIIDDYKRVNKLGIKTPLPVEVSRFAHKHSSLMLERLGCIATLRMEGNEPFVTDENHFIYDCMFNGISYPEELSNQIMGIPGVIECGLFIDLVDSVLSYKENGSIQEYRR